MLYYPTQQEALQSHNAISAEDIAEYSCEPHISVIIENGQKTLSVQIEEQQIEKSIYRLKTPLGYVDTLLTQDLTDGRYFDIVQFKEYYVGELIEPITWAITNAERFVSTHIHRNIVSVRMHSIRKYGEAKLPKPAELRGKQQDFSVLFCGRSKCGCFVVGTDIWIKHRDFFSTMWHPPVNDIGKPQNYYLEKYFTGQSRPEKFIYADNWGGIILRSEAWLVIENIVPLIAINNIMSVRAVLENEFIATTNCGRLDPEWERFLEEVVMKTAVLGGIINSW